MLATELAWPKSPAVLKVLGRDWVPCEGGGGGFMLVSAGEVVAGACVEPVAGDAGVVVGPEAEGITCCWDT